MVQNYIEIEKKRDQLDFDIDGIVYKVNDFELQKRLGNVANAPRWATAHKFSAKNSISQITNIEIQVGRTGALTPVAKIKPVNIGGVIVSNATLHNEDEIKRKDIRIGDYVKVERAGDVIPHIISVDKSKRKSNSKTFIFPKNCPSCGSKVVKEYNKLTKKFDAVIRCSSDDYKCDKITIEKLKSEGVDTKKTIADLKLKIKNKRNEIYSSLTPWQKVQLSRHPQRPYTLDYILQITNGNFVELHGDRSFKDDKAIVGGWGSIDKKTYMFIGQQLSLIHI